jgi:20S proteasome alpha/beta subunit
MTIAVGVLGADAMILAADSQEGYGYDGGMRLQTYRIAFEGSWSTDDNDDNRAIGVTGAGDSDYLSIIKHRIMEEFKQYDDLQSFETHLHESVCSFYEKHVIPFNSQQWGNLAVDLIVAGVIQNTSAMWYTSRNVVTPCSGWVARGSGESWVKYLLKESSTDIKMKEATILAAYAVFVAKQRAEGCGMHTELIAIPRDNSLVYVADRKALDAMGKLFAKYEEHERRSFWSALHGLDYHDDEDEPVGLPIDVCKEVLEIDPYEKYNLSKRLTSQTPSS